MKGVRECAEHPGHYYRLECDACRRLRAQEKWLPNKVHIREYRGKGKMSDSELEEVLKLSVFRKKIKLTTTIL